MLLHHTQTQSTAGNSRPTTCTTRPGQIRVGIIGHSFIACMSNGRTWSNLNLPVAQFKVRMQGQGGQTMKKLRLWSPTELGFHSGSPNFLFVDIGSNDLCDRNMSAEVLARHVTAFTEYLCVAHGIQVIYIGQVLQRFRLRRDCPFTVEEYRSRAIEYNIALRRLLASSSEKICYWRHRGGFWGPKARELFHQDGVYLNQRKGIGRYIRSIQQAVSHAKSQGLI